MIVCLRTAQGKREGVGEGEREATTAEEITLLYSIYGIYYVPASHFWGTFFCNLYPVNSGNCSLGSSGMKEHLKIEAREALYI